MQLIKLNKNYTIVCESKSTRSGFKHVASIIKNGLLQGKVKCCYQNRTWESYQFQMVLNKALTWLKDNDPQISKNLLTRFKNTIK